MQQCNAQNVQGVIGISTEIGSHYRRIGIKMGAWNIYKNTMQLNTLANVFYNFRNIGPKGKFWETQICIGANVGFGSQNELYYNPSFYNEQQNRVQKNWQLSYIYKLYFDTRGTSQQTGTIQIQYKRLKLFSQNDGQCFTPWDKFRTGTLQLKYDDSLFSIGSNIILWTGDGKTGIRREANNARFGIIDISESKLGKYSAGLAYLSCAVALPYNQNTFLQLGVDDEKVRDIFQNKLVHDNLLIHWINPKAKNPELPMLDTKGYPFEGKANQIKKKTKLYWQIGWNETTGY